MRPHRAAAVFVRIDQRRQRHRAFDRRIEPDAQLAQEIEVRPKPGHYDQLVDDDVTAAATSAGADGEARAVEGEIRNAKFALHFYLAGRDQLSECGAKLASGAHLAPPTSAKR